MTANGVFVLCLLVGVPLVFGLWGLWTQALRHRHALRLQRLTVLHEALRHPELDEGTRRELLALLGREHGQRWRLAYGVYLALAWCGFVVCGACWVYYGVRGWSEWQLEPLMLGTVVAFAMLTLPFAVRELLGRVPAVTRTR
jgi:Na+/melibiose symporter-like transporter